MRDWFAKIEARRHILLCIATLYGVELLDELIYGLQGAVLPYVWLKYALLALISFSTSGWFPILRGRTYTVLPGQAGMIVAVTSLGNVSSVFVPLIFGRVADVFGLQWAMWLLAVGPLVLIVGLPRRPTTNDR